MAEVDLATVELAVGLDTFRPVMVDRLDDDHVMHTEWYRVPDETIAAIESARRVVAIDDGGPGRRIMEAHRCCAVERSDLFIRRPYDWQVVDVLLTNFTFHSRHCSVSSMDSSGRVGGSSTRQQSPRSTASSASATPCCSGWSPVF